MTNKPDKNKPDRSDEITYYDSMYSYAGDADISHYVLTTHKEAPSSFIVADFCPSEDEDFYVGEELEYRGNRYMSVGWGEDERSAILETELCALCYALYEFVEGNEYMQKYVSDGIVYETREDATRAGEELYDDDDDTIESPFIFTMTRDEAIADMPRAWAENTDMSSLSDAELADAWKRFATHAGTEDWDVIKIMG